MFNDILVSFSEIERHLRLNPLALSNMPFVIEASGTQAAWLSDVAFAARKGANLLAARLAVARAEERAERDRRLAAASGL